MLETVLNTLLPTRCPMCRRHLQGTEIGVCTACLAQLEPQFEGNLLHLGEYATRLERVVRALKFAEARRVAHPLGKILAQAVQDKSWHVDAVVPIPLHATRANLRGYNQAELLAGAIAQGLGVPSHEALKRVRATQQQARLAKSERLKNLEGAFALQKSVTGLELLLIDDVYTSGTTLTEASLVLIEAGAKRVRMAVLARA
ncbi:MAG: ComF family protein [Deinococcales bacterium]